VAQSV